MGDVARWARWMRGALVRTLAALGLVIGLAGCATFHRRPLDAAASGQHLLARRLSNKRLLTFLAAMGQPTAPARWGLKSLTLVALYERPDVKLAHASLSAALAHEITARALPNPTLSLSPTYNSSDLVPSPWKIGPLVTFLIQSYGARPAQIAEARDLMNAARAKVVIAAWRQRALVRRAFLALWYARAQLRLTRRGAALAAKVASVTQQRYRAGMISAATDNVAAITAEQQHFAQALAARRVRLARAGLAGAIGMPVSALRGIKLDFAAFDDHPLPAHLGALRAAALAARPDIQAALANYQAAQNKLRFAIASQYPSLQIGPGYLYDQGQNKYVLGLSLPLPIFNQNQGPIAAARAGRAVAAAQFDRTQQQALAQIDNAITDLRASQRTVQAARAAVRAAATRVHYAKNAFAAGATGRLRLIGAQQAAYYAQFDLLTARDQERTAIGQVESALYHPIFGDATS